MMIKNKYSSYNFIPFKQTNYDVSTLKPTCIGYPNFGDKWFKETAFVVQL